MKFRVWNKLAMKFTPEAFIAMQGDGKFITWDVDMGAWDDPFSYNPDNSIIVIQRYTGFKDANEREIYEGDIVDVRFPYPVTKLNGPATVHWSESGGYWMIRAGKSRLPALLHTASTIEVIGDIFQDPHLLERKEDE